MPNNEGGDREEESGEKESENGGENDANVVTWKSVDGGLNWNAFRGAPGGDDYHRIWINPLHPDVPRIVRRINELERGAR